LETFFEKNEIGLSGINEIKQVFELVKCNGFDNSNIIFDFRLARGLSYYTGLIYEGKAVDLPFGSIVGGGRYDDLTTAFGLPNMSGVGISFGIERIIDVMNELNLFPDVSSSGSKVLFTYFNVQGQSEALKHVSNLRKNNIPSEIYPDISKVKKAFEFADKKNIPFVAVIGESEIQENKISLKNMKNGEQQLLSISELIQFFN
jgi:histidyl-tRNA synthetase